MAMTLNTLKQPVVQRCTNLWIFHKEKLDNILRQMKVKMQYTQIMGCIEISAEQETYSFKRFLFKKILFIYF